MKAHFDDVYDFNDDDLFSYTQERLAVSFARYFLFTLKSLFLPDVQPSTPASHQVAYFSYLLQGDFGVYAFLSGLIFLLLLFFFPFFIIYWDWKGRQWTTAGKKDCLMRITMFTSFSVLFLIPFFFLHHLFSNVLVQRHDIYLIKRLTLLILGVFSFIHHVNVFKHSAFC